MSQPLQRRLKEPGVRHALHFAVAGALLFIASIFFDRDAPKTETRVVSVPAARIDQARDVFASKHHRAPTDREMAGIVRHLVDQEILFRHALALGLDRQEPVQRRLAQIATFVSEAHDATRRLSADERAARAEEAKRLGLHHDDVVIRRILVDSARRLIRGAVLTKEPSEEAMQQHLDRHPERFRRRETIAFDWRQSEEDDIGSVPALTRTDLERRFGRAFVANLDATRVGIWQGPIASRNGAILVRVTSHQGERRASLDEVRDRVRNEVKDQLADRWLEARLDQLRNGVEIELPKDPHLPTLAKLQLAVRIRLPTSPVRIRLPTSPDPPNLAQVQAVRPQSEGRSAS